MQIPQMLAEKTVQGRTFSCLALAALMMAGAAAPLAAQQFQSPTGNIACIAYGPGLAGDYHQIRCDIRSYVPTWTQPPEDCELDWGGVFFLTDEGKAERGCVGDVGAGPDAPVLPYGQTFRAGQILCRMERSGLSCTNASGHGFFMSRATQRLF